MPAPERCEECKTTVTNPAAHESHYHDGAQTCWGHDVTPNDGPIIVICDNPQHRVGGVNRFPTMGLAESFLLGNAVMGDCLRDHHVTDTRDKNAAMRDLGDLLASLMPDPDDSDDCGQVLG